MTNEVREDQFSPEALPDSHPCSSQGKAHGQTLREVLDANTKCKVPERRTLYTVRDMLAHIQSEVHAHKTNTHIKLCMPLQQAAAVGAVGLTLHSPEWLMGTCRWLQIPPPPQDPLGEKSRSRSVTRHSPTHASFTSLSCGSHE